MVSQGLGGDGAGIVGFVGLDELSLEMAAALVRSGYKVQAFEVNSCSFFVFAIWISSHAVWLRGKKEADYGN